MRTLVGRREDLDARHQSLLGRGLVDFDEGLAMLLLNKGTHQDRFGFVNGVRHGSPTSFPCGPLAPLGRHADIGKERMAGLAVLFHQDDIGSFSGPHEVTLGSDLSQGVLDLGNEVKVEISPQPAGLDIGIHAWKWRFQEPLLEMRSRGGHSAIVPFSAPGADNRAREGDNCGAIL